MAYSQEELNGIISALIIDNNLNMVTPAKVRQVLFAITSILDQQNAAAVSAAAPLDYDPFTNTFSIPKADAESDGYLSKEDWASFNEGGTIPDIEAVLGAGNVVRSEDRDLVFTDETTSAGNQLSKLFVYLFDSVKATYIRNGSISFAKAGKYTDFSFEDPTNVTNWKIRARNADGDYFFAGEDQLVLKADLVSGKVPSSQLPSYVDDIVEGYLLSNIFYTDAGHTTVIPAESGKIYIDLTTGQKNKEYRYSGSAYIQITNGLIASTADVPEDSGFLYFTNSRALSAVATVFQTEITATSTTFDSAKKGDNKLFPFKSTSNQTLTINSGVYIENDVINIERRGSGELEIIQGTGVRFRGVRTLDNRFFVGDSNTMVSLLCRGSEIFSIIGNLRRGGAVVTISSYDDLIYTDVNKSINVYGTGFSTNMIVTLTGNATQVTPFTYVNANQITLHLTSTGVAGNAITVTYDNGDVFQDTNAIVLLSGALTYVADSNPFSFGYALFKLAKTQVYGLQVRRDSDNAIVDVKFDSFGRISLSSFVSTGVTLGTWAGSANVFIVTKYNQGTSGGNYNLTQNDTTKQAKLLNAGALIIQGSRMFAEFDGTNDAYSTPGNDNWCSGNLHVFADVRSKSLANGLICGYFPNTPRTTERLLQFKYDSTGIISAIAALENGSTVTASGGVAAINTNFNTVYSRNATNQLVYLNGTAGTAAVALSTYPSESKAIEHGGLIDDLNTAYLNGYNNYLIIYKIDNRASISAIQTIINAFL